MTESCPHSKIVVIKETALLRVETSTVDRETKEVVCQEDDYTDTGEDEYIYKCIACGASVSAEGDIMDEVYEILGY